uniref:LysM, putative peptidoglycan-binding, domain containing 3 n=1 Tax=Fundulus heteroclitus TaxID=8078 RepID=A0A3Q2QVN7_FUNHE
MKTLRTHCLPAESSKSVKISFSFKELMTPRSLTRFPLKEKQAHSMTDPCGAFPHNHVADIKRANNLLTEQDFFALRSVKIPVRRFSVLTETHGAGPPKPVSPPGARRVPQISAATPLPTESSTDSCSSADSVEGFLLEKDKDIEQLVKSTGPSRSSLSEVVSSLTLQQQQQPLLGGGEYKPVQRRKDPYYGADWGMRWWTAVAIMLFVGIVTPVFYLLYYEVLVKSDASHHGVPTQPYGGGKIQPITCQIS